MVTQSKRQHRRTPRSQQGLTLMELMVALALGGFLVLGVVNVFLTTRESSSVEAALARVQESGRFAMDILADDLRRANYTGCNSVGRSADVMINDFNYVGLRGYTREDGGWSHPIDANDPSLEHITTEKMYVGGPDIEDVIRPGTEVLNLHMASFLGDDLLQADVGTNDTSFELDGNPGCRLDDGDAVVISNCLTANIFVADVNDCGNDPNTPTTVTVNAVENTFGKGFGGGYMATQRTQILEFESVSWFVGDTGRDRDGESVFALYRQALERDPVEMIEGVEFMQVLYGQRTGEDGNITTRFVRADDADIDWDRVISVRIGLLVQNYEPVRDANDPRIYVLADPNSPIGPDRHGGGLVLRQAFRTTTALRNTDYDL